MSTDWPDIALHTAPTVAVGIGMGFLAATALEIMVPPLSYLVAVLSLSAAIAFSWIWTPREKAQHGGQLGGRQSQLEAFVPFIVGPVSFCVSLAAFWIFPV